MLDKCMSAGGHQSRSEDWEKSEGSPAGSEDSEQGRMINKREEDW